MAPKKLVGDEDTYNKIRRGKSSASLMPYIHPDWGKPCIHEGEPTATPCAPLSPFVDDQEFILDEKLIPHGFHYPGDPHPELKCAAYVKAIQKQDQVMSALKLDFEKLREKDKAAFISNLKKTITWQQYYTEFYAEALRALALSDSAAARSSSDGRHA